MYKRNCNILLIIITIMGSLLSASFIMIVENIISLKELLFFKQFFIFGLLFIIVLPIILIYMSNLYFYITGKKDWFNWLKISEIFDDVFSIIALFPFFFSAIEMAIFLGYYRIADEINEILLYIISAIFCGLMFSLSQISIRKIFSKEMY
ncbi:MAG: hypothetical protein LBP20_00485 [Treponema sp.]|nr:hypothetical protein [Treponema sp.]